MSQAVELLKEVMSGARPMPVSPWRRKVRDLRNQIVALIRENADPESRHQIARETGEDILYQMSKELRAEYGCVFDTLIDRVRGDTAR